MTSKIQFDSIIKVTFFNPPFPLPLSSSALYSFFYPSYDLVESGAWDDESRIWNLKYTNNNGELCHETFKFIIGAIGPLSRPYIPKEHCEDLKKFKGTYFHSASWNNEFDFRV
jgi:cation diffusion facilitator CzcD-associated flavoprotein CzcO